VASEDRAEPRARLDMGVDAPGSTNTRFGGGSGRPGPSRPAALAVALGSTSVLLAASVLGMVLAAIAFLIVLAAVGWSIYEIYQIGHPAPAKK